MPASFPVLSLIQGISEQSAFSRPQSSALNQENCINDLLRGARARLGTRVVSHYEANLDSAFFHRIERSLEEDYLICVTAEGLRIFNLADGEEAEITYGATVSPTIVATYLAHSGKTRNAFCASTVNDTTFLANREVVLAMDSEESLPRNNWGIAHFKSANYSTDYKLTVTDENGNSYSASYKTPDNSTASNADHIATNRLAEDFAQAMTNALPSGWGVNRTASSILISHDTLKFEVTSEDGLGGQQFTAFTDRTKQVSDLPNAAWDGYTVAIGSKRSAGEADYYLRYSGTSQNGVWEEVVAPETKLTFDAFTMPLHIRNTDVNAFEVEHAPWGKRVAGDGINSAKEPSFIGTTIKDLQFIDSRLAIITEGAATMSRSRNGYVFFPDTVQTTLDTDPIDYTVANGKVTNLTRSVVISKHLQLWANGVQSVMSGGQDALKEDTAENPPVTNYEYDGQVAPITVGQSSLIFVTSNGAENTFLEVIFKEATPVGEIEINAHCPAIVSGTVRHMAAGGTGKVLFVLNEEDLTTCPIYQWYNNGQERVQSAWNYWKFPGSDAILWISSTGSTVKALVKHGDRVAIEHLEMKPNTEEPGLVPLRADHRLDEGSVSSVVHDGEVYTVTLPWGLTDTQKENFTVYARVDDEGTGERRGLTFPVTWVSSTEFTFKCAIPSLRFWCGHVPIAKRTSGRLYLYEQDGTILLDTLHVDAVRVQHKDTTHYSIEIAFDGTDLDDIREDFWPGRIGDQQTANNKLAVARDGMSAMVDIGATSEAFTMTILNDTIYPSSWEAMEFIYRAEKRYHAGR